jgi:hypothetical protein
LQELEVQDALAIESPNIKPQSWPPSSRNSARWVGRGSCVKPYKDLATFMVRFSCSPAKPYFLRGEQRISNPNLHAQEAGGWAGGGPGNGPSTEGIAVPSSTGAHLRLQDALGLSRSRHAQPHRSPARSIAISNSKKGQHRRSLATNSATARSTFPSGECLRE